MFALDVNRQPYKEALLEIYLPYVHPHYPWWCKLCLRLFNWVLWYLPALSVVADPHVGSQYQTQVTFFVAMGLALPATSVLFFPITTEMMGLLQYNWWGPNTLVAFALYLFVGALYYCAEKYGSY